MAIEWIVILTSFAYLLLLFLIAGWAENNFNTTWLSSPYIYALSLAVYCTAWTYYGSVGRAAYRGIDFITTYIGPILVAPLFWLVLRKVIRISNSLRITTIADFISARYGKRASLGALVTLVCVMSIIPYMSIQLKAISMSFGIFSVNSNQEQGWILNDTAFYITCLLGLFVIIFGMRNIDASRKNIGLIVVIAFESLFKLFAFVVLGFYVSYGLFDGLTDIFSSAKNLPDYDNLISINDDNGYSNWFWLNLLSMFAVVLLPRQFHVAVKENRDENHILRATWLFPLYLFLINFFVIPIAFGGRVFFGDTINADTFVLALPLANHHTFLAILVYLGGFAAATSMIIVSTSALSIMLNNNFLVPLVLRNKFLENKFQDNLNTFVLRGKQLMIILMLLLAYFYFKMVGEKFSLVSIGLISFVGIAQFAPTFFGALFWKQGNYSGAFYGMLVGVLLWFFILVIPTLVSANIISKDITEVGMFGVSFLNPHSFLGLETGNFITQGFMWSFLANLATYVVVSLLTKRSIQETNQSEVFVDIFKYSTVYESAVLWKGRAFFEDIKKLLATFLGEERTKRAFEKFRKRNDIKEESIEADFRVVNFSEKLLAGVVGSASAKVILSSVVKEEKIDLHEVFDILHETQKYISDNKELKKKSHELKIASVKLKKANEELTKLDQLKNEFISTVTHEMRTPITSIRAFSEILSNHDDISLEERNQFLKTIVEETKRMERLINQVLDLEKMESGKFTFEFMTHNLNQIVKEALNIIQNTLKEKKIKVKKDLENNLPLILANKDRLMQVVLNLLSNAQKFSPNESGMMQLITKSTDEYVIFSVIDNGVGIPLENQEYIFEAFYQAKNQTLKKPEGTGLGLTISKKIIEKHGGQIWVVSEVNTRTEFSFSIPIKR